MLEIEVNAMIWGIFMSATIKSTGQVKQLFDFSQKLILKQSEEILRISTFVWNTIP